MMPLNEDEIAELTLLLNFGHATKSNVCRGCLEAEGPCGNHRSFREIDKATHILHIDFAGLLTLSDHGFISLRRSGPWKSHRLNLVLDMVSVMNY